MSTVVLQQPRPIRQTPTPPPHTPALSLTTTPRSNTPVPNKHIPICSPGPVPNHNRIPATPPASPQAKVSPVQTFSVLYPPNNHARLSNSPPVYTIDASVLATALDQLATQPLPEPKQVFPWLHGLHSENLVQLAFFVARRKTLRKTPRCFRTITLVKAGGDLSTARLKGAVAPEEILPSISAGEAEFLDCDPREGFSVRNFHIQTPKVAALSDIVVYGDDSTDKVTLNSLAERIAIAQKCYKRKMDPTGQEQQLYNTFVLSTSFKEVERKHRNLVAIGSTGQTTGHTMDFLQWERLEMCNMSKASEIANNVWLGPSPDWNSCSANKSDLFDIYIEASDLAQVPDGAFLNEVAEQSAECPQRFEFPSSGSIMPPSWSQAEVDGLVETCRWLYDVTNPSKREQSMEIDGDIQMTNLSAKPRKVLIHCADGYTESSLLAIAYYMYAEGVPVHEAWLRLHCDKKRNFFAYPSDVALLNNIQGRILEESPKVKWMEISKLLEPDWLARMDGSLPSRILPYMYLGNLTHANNPLLLRALGIHRVLSVGEPVAWTGAELEDWGAENLMMVDKTQDNGIDPLTGEFDRCLEFIRTSPSPTSLFSPS